MSTGGVALANRVQRLRSFVASKTGVQQFNVYGLTNATPTTGQLFGDPKLTGVDMSMRRVTKRDAYETQPFDLQTHHGITSIVGLSYGDIFVQQPLDGFAPDSSRFCFAQQRPLRENLFVIVDRDATIKFATSAAEPSSFGVDLGDTDTGRTPSTELVMAWNGSAFYKAAPGAATAFVLPIGIQQTARAGPGRTPGLETSEGMGRFTIYIPPTPGLQLDVTDRIVVGLERYELLQVLTDAGSGLRGTVAIASRQAADA
jgi:hypothetical protein